MTPKKTTKLHFKIHVAKKTSKKQIFFYDENANDIAEEVEPPQDAIAITNASIAAAAVASNHSEAENSSIIVAINDDSGCFSSDTSLKLFAEKTEKTRKSKKRLLVTQRTAIDGSLWDIKNDSNQEAFIAIYVKKSLDQKPQPSPSTSPQCVSVGNSKELPQELSTVSVQVGEQFCLRTTTLESIRENGMKKKKRVAAVVQRKNEWKKFKL